MRTINRSALLVRPREPYIAWTAGVDEDSPALANSLRNETSVYLVAADPAGREESAPLEGYYAQIFESELEAWDTDESGWPVERDMTTFLKWFEVEARSIVCDLEKVPVDTEE